MKSINKVRKKIVVIVGSNSSGKSNLGIFLAKKLQGEIISADSRQIYKNLDVGSGKITKKEMRSIPHYCLDIANPKKIFTAYDYKKCAQDAIKEIWNKGMVPIVVGGTGFYVDAALGRVKLSNVPANLKLRKRLAKKSVDQLFLMLKKLNPERAKNIDKNNKVRLIRAIEIATYKIKDKKLKIKNTNPSLKINSENILWIGMKRSPKDLKKRIHNRLLRRLQSIIKEVNNLHNPPAGGGLSWKRLFELGLEYRYISLHLRGKLSKGNMLKKLETEINKYAKRQVTYFKRNKEINWVSSEKEAKKLSQRFWLA